MKVGITGQNGFIGRHLYNYLNLQEGLDLVEFAKSYFEDAKSLTAFVEECDVIVHLAAMNRHEDSKVIYDTNLSLVNRLVDTLKKTSAKPHVLFASSTQEDLDNDYGKSKLLGGDIIKEWAESSDALYTAMVIPNVFGPFGKPFYNSVVATFCHLIANGEEVNITGDKTLDLIYVNELVAEIYAIMQNKTNGKVKIPAYHQITVKEIAQKLKAYKSQYIDKGEFPSLDNSTDLALFNSFRCYIPESHYPVAFTKHSDDRGSFVEIARTNSKGQFSFSTTVPNITRGEHFHTRKAERFAVIKGKARIQLRKVDSDEVIEYTLDGETPAFVDMPIWHTHNITNIGDEELLTLFWINEPYNPDDADTYYVKVVQE